MDLSWRETAEVLEKEVGMKIPHNSLFKAANAWLYRQTELEKWPDTGVAAKRSTATGTTGKSADDWQENSAESVNLPEVKIRKPREQ